MSNLSKDAASAQYQARGAKGQFASNKGGSSLLSGVVDRRRIGMGMNKANIVTLEDGSKAIEKTVWVLEGRTEIIAYELGKKMGVNVPETVDAGEADGKTIVRQQFVDGDIGANVLGSPKADELVSSEAGARLAAYDYLMKNADRHSQNWLVGSNGELVAIDNGLADPWSGPSSESDAGSSGLDGGSGFGSVFADFWSGSVLPDAVLESIAGLMEDTTLPEGFRARAELVLKYGELPAF